MNLQQLTYVIAVADLGSFTQAAEKYLDERTVPTLDVHGRSDPFFPVRNGEALAAVTRPRQLVWQNMGTALPDAAATRLPPRCSTDQPLGGRVLASVAFRP